LPRSFVDRDGKAVGVELGAEALVEPYRESDTLTRHTVDVPEKKSVNSPLIFTGTICPIENHTDQSHPSGRPARFVQVKI
jgi:hypothetical protein